MAAAPPPPDCCQVIDGDGGFQESQLASFVAQSGVIDAGTNYQVVAIMGPQSSGKSTLMNHVFGTKFQEMDAMTGRQQTTKGVWLAKSPKLCDVATLVMDLEGSDGRERGEDDTNFERQSALFALAVADVLLINVWCHDIGREQGSGKPLMKTIFQVNLKLFAPEPNRRRTVLLFVIRDKSKTPLTKLAEILGDDLGKMWDGISKPPQYEGSRMDDFFEVQFTGLPHYEDKYEDFLADTVVLRRRFSPDGESSLVRDTERLPADAFVLSTANIWSIIRSQKDLNLPAHKVMVANIRCSEIKAEQLVAFGSDQAWRGLEADAGAGLVRDFGARLAALMDSCVKGYEVEARYFDAGVRTQHADELRAKLVDAVAPAHRAQARLLAASVLEAFDKDLRLGLVDAPRSFSEVSRGAVAGALRDFDARAGELDVPGSGLAVDDARASLATQLDEAVDKAKHARTKEALHATEATLSKLIAVPAVELLSAFPPNLWQQLHTVRKQAVASASSELSSSLEGVELSEAEAGGLSAKLNAAADKKLGDLLQEAALTRVSKMRDVFNAHFSLDEHGTPRTWRPRDNIPQLARAARRESARVLALLAVQRPASYAGGDAVESAVMTMARKDVDDGGDGGDGPAVSAASSSAARGVASFELSTATAWPGVAREAVLIAPHEARLAWREFMSASALSVQQAQVTQQANLMAGKRSAPVWALAAILFLGWNEFMAVLWNPIYLLLGGALFLFGAQMYSELDVDAEMQRGPVMGAMALWGKAGDGLRRVLHHNVELLQNLSGVLVEMATQGGQQQQQRMQPAFAGAGAGGEEVLLGGGGAGQLQQQQQHLSAPGLKQRPKQQDVQMTALGSGANSSSDSNGDAAGEGKEA